jgi:hypothetical protein
MINGTNQVIHDRSMFKIGTFRAIVHVPCAGAKKNSLLNDIALRQTRAVPAGSQGVPAYKTMPDSGAIKLPA